MFDYISVDGRSRMQALERALPLLKPQGGILMLDNSDRSRYQEAFDMVPSWWLKVCIIKKLISGHVILLLCLSFKTFCTQASHPPTRNLCRDTRIAAASICSAHVSGLVVQSARA